MSRAGASTDHGGSQILPCPGLRQIEWGHQPIPVQLEMVRGEAAHYDMVCIEQQMQPDMKYTWSCSRLGCVMLHDA